MRRGACVPALALVLGSLPAAAAVLIEAEHDGQDLRLVVDRGTDRVRIERAGRDALVDLEGGAVYYLEGEGAPVRIHARFRPGHGQLWPYRVEVFGPGPIRAGHVTTYHVLFVQDEVCAEVLTSAWMTPFVDPAVRALAVLEGLEAGADERTEACGTIPITTLAATGWPLLVGKIDHPTFETTTVRFDYRPEPGELALPAPWGEPGSPAPILPAAGPGQRSQM